MTATSPDPRTPRQIGPYRIEERLGAGGMGEVYRAYDERLERSVAVKLIRPEAAADGRARERLRREARAAAGVSHPLLVQVFDILEYGETEAIVMELVEGEPLSLALRQGPLALAAGVRLGREVAEGLTVAHERGILHRDLKVENVMITADGHVKILDFGIAQRTGADPHLTQPGAVIGTYRCMSPEQAQGLLLDPRSDLFSLGVLLYETLTDVSPFQGVTPLETLTRVCSHRQKPLAEVLPTAPAALSRLLDDLLQKDPLLRPASARQVAAELMAIGRSLPRRESSGDLTEIALFAGEGTTPTDRCGPRQAVPTSRPASAPRGGSGRRRAAFLAPAAALPLAAGLGWWLWQGLHPPREPLYVAVPPVEVVQGASLPGVGVLVAGLRSALVSQLAALDAVLPLETEPNGAPADARALARGASAAEVVTARLSCDPAVCQVSLNRIRGRDGASLWAESFAVPVEQPYVLPEAVLGHLQSAYPDRPVRGQGRLEVRADDYKELFALYEEFDLRRDERIPLDRILTRLAAIRRSSPCFLEALLFEAYIFMDRYRYSRQPEDLEHLLAVLGQARGLAPDDPRPLFGTIEAAMLGDRLDQADGPLRTLERLQPGDARLLALRGRLLAKRGDRRQAIALITEAVRRLPSWRHLFWLADLEYKTGDVQGARAHLHELLARSPGNHIGQSLLAQLELASGSPEKAAELYSDLVRRSPQYTDLGNLGLAQFLLGRFAEAEGSYHRAVELQPRNTLALLNLADATLLSGHRQEAKALYELAIQIAGKDRSAGSDWQLASVRAQSLAHLGSRDEAVAAVQEALRLAPDNPQAAYEASVVYVLLGDEASARYNAGRALQMGYAPRWFSFPWFDSLRDLPEFRTVVTPAPKPRPGSLARMSGGTALGSGKP